MKATLLQCTDWRKAAYAARTCYDSHDKSAPESDLKLLQNIIKRGHDSVLEFINITWEIECSRACSHQLVRHRIASYAQQSQRYVKLNAENEQWYMMPPKIEHHPDTTIIADYAILMDDIERFYGRMVAAGIPPEDARYILPNATNTVLTVSMNLRSFRNFLSLRLERHAQWEIRGLANEMLIALYEYPEVSLLATQGVKE
ncbi:FAD-dependent thymidylate synthase [Chrysiogenes arsenatis]|uniref:FAD-dependent thymidylate synthase n=1 Tax=Chrysiogenes arsenatis TaxID=309797 RepID=UPI0004278081|nr:FAD-dependent thymidylate synthase [Chrysiogenes arsenatis]